MPRDDEDDRPWRNEARREDDDYDYDDRPRRRRRPPPPEPLRPLKRLAGGFMLLLGTVLVAWVGYNLFIEMQPAAAGRSPIPALLFSAALFYVGAMWVQGKQAG